MNYQKLIFPLGGLFGVVGGGAFLVNESMYNVDGGHRAVVFNKITGVNPAPVPEGTHFLIPFIEKVTIFDCRSRPRIYRSQTGTRDLQTVSLSLRLLSRPDPHQIPTIYRTLGTNYDEKVLDSITHEVLKSVVAQYNATQLLNQRDQISRTVRERLTERARDFNILLDDLSLTEITFSPEFAAATEAKQVAQQEAETAKYIVEKALQEKRSTIVKAEGDAKSIKLLNETLREKPGYLAIRRLETARDIANIIANSNNRVYLGADALLLDVSEVEKIMDKQALSRTEAKTEPQPTTEKPAADNNNSSSSPAVQDKQTNPVTLKTLDLTIIASLGALVGSSVAFLLGSR